MNNWLITTNTVLQHHGDMNETIFGITFPDLLYGAVCLQQSPDFAWESRIELFRRDTTKVRALAEHTPITNTSFILSESIKKELNLIDLTDLRIIEVKLLYKHKALGTNNILVRYYLVSEEKKADFLRKLEKLKTDELRNCMDLEAEIIQTTEVIIRTITPTDIKIEKEVIGHF